MRRSNPVFSILPTSHTSNVVSDSALEAVLDDTNQPKEHGYKPKHSPGPKNSSTNLQTVFIFSAVNVAVLRYAYLCRSTQNRKLADTIVLWWRSFMLVLGMACRIWKRCG